VILRVRNTQGGQNGDNTKDEVSWFHAGIIAAVGPFLSGGKSIMVSMLNPFWDSSVSITAVLQLVALGVIVGIGICVIYAIREMREVYTDHRKKFLRAIDAVEELRKLQPEFLSVLQRMESDTHALQTIALQIEVSVAGLKHGVSASLYGATERQTSAIWELRDHLDSQEDRLIKILESVSHPQPAPHSNGNGQNGNGSGNGTSNGNGNGNGNGQSKANGNGSYARLRRDVISQDPQVRFTVLKEWVNTNTLAILHRASRGFTTPAELIVNIPPHLEAEAALTPDRVLLINTRGYAEKVALQLNDLDPMDHEVLSRRTDV
jgi:hypothetical protein